LTTAWMGTGQVVNLFRSATAATSLRVRSGDGVRSALGPGPSAPLRFLRGLRFALGQGALPSFFPFANLFRTVHEDRRRTRGRSRHWLER
jgi:hypothetical protein